MTGFAADWLALREPADAAARAATLLDALDLAAWRPEPLRVVDLGAGTGANFRYLAPRLGGRQRWRLVDDDEALLRRSGGRDIELELVDLAASLETLALPRRSLVTASALLDLVSANWLRSLAARCAEAEAAVLFALTYDGRIEALPRHADDELVRGLVNRHQTTDKGFGPALGPAAAVAAVEAFVQHGYRMRWAPSDWRLDPGQSELQRALIEGWTTAAQEIAPEHAARIDRWRSARLEHVDAGRSTIVVGHRDVAGGPAAR